MSDELGPDGAPTSRQRPMKVDRNEYRETGALRVAGGPPGQLPVIVGDEPSQGEPGLTDDFVCSSAPGRPPCVHYVATLYPAQGVARGFERLHEIRRFCVRLATAAELFELDGYMLACTARVPQDERSLALIEDFEAKQKQAAKDNAEVIGEEDL